MASPGLRFTTPSALRGPAAMAILDEAAALLRRAPLSVVAIYILGALPFCLGLLYFWSDMVQSANAETRLPGEAFLLALLYFWMKTCQAVFSRKLLALVEDYDPEPWTLSRWLNTALLQGIFAGSLIVVYPVSLLVALPFAWVNAFYHTISIVATGPGSTVRSSLREAGEMAALWPKQNHLILAILLMAFFILFLNLAVFFFVIPELLNSFLGIETVFDENAWALSNSSFYLDIVVFCYLLLNPLNKAIYVLRCFYGRSRLSGADLRSKLRRQNSGRLGKIGALALVLLMVAPAVSGWAQQSPTVASSSAAQAQPTLNPAASRLNQSIQKTLKKDEFAWRMPRAEEPAQNVGFFGKMMNHLGKWLKKMLGGTTRALAKFLDWLFGGARELHPDTQSLSRLSSFPWRALMVFLAIILGGVMAYFVWRHSRLYRKGPAPTVLTPTAVRTVDLEAEHVQADDLPEESWLALAQQLIEKGELRLALRAFYLATLSSLARQQLVRLAAAKSNRDYLAELTRRLRGETSVVPFFRENVKLFEASWYGTHAVTTAIIDSMRKNQQQVRGHVAA